MNYFNQNHLLELLTPLMVCCFTVFESEEVNLVNVNLLLDFNAEVNLRNKYGKTALMLAIENGHSSIVNKLLSVTNLDVNIQDKEGFTVSFIIKN